MAGNIGKSLILVFFGENFFFCVVDGDYFFFPKHVENFVERNQNFWRILFFNKPVHFMKSVIYKAQVILWVFNSGNLGFRILTVDDDCLNPKASMVFSQLMHESELIVDIFPELDQLVELEATNILVVIRVLFVLGDNSSLTGYKLINNTCEIFKTVDFFEEGDGIAIVFIKVVGRQESL